MSPSLLPLPSFEELSRLARERPGDFEALRASLVEDFIAHAPRRLESRLRGLQFRVDQTRRLAKSDYGAALRVFGMMWESFESLATLWRELPKDLANPARTGAAGPHAVVLCLDDRRRTQAKPGTGD
jgi:hypothetical protein